MTQWHSEVGGKMTWLYDTHYCLQTISYRKSFCSVLQPSFSLKPITLDLTTTFACPEFMMYFCLGTSPDKLREVRAHALSGHTEVGHCSNLNP